MPEQTIECAEARCPACGTVFWLPFGRSWGWTLARGRATVEFCSYSCMRRFERAYPPKEYGQMNPGRRGISDKQREEVVRLRLAGMTTYQISAITLVSRENVARICKKAGIM